MKKKCCKFLLFLSLFISEVHAYECKVIDNAFVLQADRAVEIIVINKIETISAVNFKGELSLTLMSGKKRDFICPNNTKIIEEIMKQLKD